MYNALMNRKLQKKVANSDSRRTSRRPKETDARGKKKIGEFYGNGKTSLYCHFMLASLSLNLNLSTISFFISQPWAVCQSDSPRHTCVTQPNLTLTD